MRRSSFQHYFDLHYIYAYTVVKPLEAPLPARRPTIDPELLRQAAGEAVTALKVLANEERLLLLCQLSQGEMCVSELEEALDIHQPTLSQQLGVLRAEAAVNTRRDGKRIYYSVADPGLMQVLEVLYRVYCPKE